MITSVVIKSGYAAKLPKLPQNVEFTSGLNILFGPNGCGKSTLIKICAAYSSIVNGGWSCSMTPHHLFRACKNLQYPRDFKYLSPGKGEKQCVADVVWDGTPSFLLTSDNDNVRSAAHFFWDEADSPDGVTSVNEQMLQLMSSPSAGEVRLMKLGKILKGIRQIPKINEMPAKYKNANSTWTECIQTFIDYVNTLPKNGPQTILFDEPDKSLSIQNQILFWLCLSTKLKDMQVIVATHSFVPLMMKGLEANWIAMEKNYIDNSQKAIHSLTYSTPEEVLKNYQPAS